MKGMGYFPDPKIIHLGEGAALIMVGGPCQGDWKTPKPHMINFKVQNIEMPPMSALKGMDELTAPMQHSSSYHLEKLYVETGTEYDRVIWYLRVWLHESVPRDDAAGLLELMQKEGLIPSDSYVATFLKKHPSF